jgi:glycosyltransferase involved in cell wall biosynthesis
VRFDGFIDDRSRESLLATATAAVYLSRYEGFGLPALEALAAGIPLVISQDRPLTDLFASAALVADASQPARLAEALAKMLDDAELRVSLARRGPELARTFSWDKCAAQTLAALRDASAQGQP